METFKHNLESNYNQIKKLSDDISDIASEIKNKHPHYISGRIVDFRLGTFDRLLSVLTVALLKIEAVKFYINREENIWQQDYFNRCLPKIYKEDSRLHLRHLSGLFNELRFNIYQKTYSNIEASMRIVCSQINIGSKKNNVFRKVNDLTGDWDDDFLNFISAIRNTIHNNGIFLPDNGTTQLTYTLNGISYIFEKKKPILVTTEDICNIVKEMCNRFKATIDHSSILELPFTLDADSKGYPA